MERNRNPIKTMEFQPVGSKSRPTDFFLTIPKPSESTVDQIHTNQTIDYININSSTSKLTEYVLPSSRRKPE